MRSNTKLVNGETYEHNVIDMTLYDMDIKI